MSYRLVLLLAALLISTSATAERSLVLARAPQLSPTVTSQLWSPFVRYLSETTGAKITLKVYTERSKFETDIKDGKVDLYFGNPGYGIVGHLRHGYIPLIRSDRKLLEGIIVAKKDGDIKSAEQLNGKVIAFPDETAFAASLYIRSRLNSDFNIDYQSIFTGSHDNTYRAVLIGKAAAGGGVTRTLERENPKLRKQLQIIYKTPGMKSHPLMAHPEVPENVRKSIQEAILNLNKDDAGKKLLKTVKLQKPVVADYSQDYKATEPFAIKMYEYLLD
jgi:phosphonate transport system substrate-binding protein